MEQLYQKSTKKKVFFKHLQKWFMKRKQEKKTTNWEKNGQPIPPPHIIKQQTLLTHAQNFGIRILVETGTYHGEMVKAMKDDFDLIYSIELSYELFLKAIKRFEGEEHIHLIHGDSGVKIKDIISIINQPILFWLDGHYSGGETAIGTKDTPIYEELNHILNDNEKRHVIIIDDARCFGEDPAYPSIEELNDFIKEKNPNLNIIVQHDSIRITPATI